MNKTACVAATFLFLGFGPVVEAAPIIYNFSGTVTQIGSTPPGVAIGEQVPISITVNDPGTGGPIYSYTQGDPGTPLIPSALFAGVDYTSLFQSISVQAGSSVNFLTTVFQTNYGFSLVLTGGHNGILTTGGLPASLNPGDFTGGVFTVTKIFESNTFYSGTINGVARVPEPASWAIFGTGLFALAWQTGRRRVRAGTCSASAGTTRFDFD